MRILRQAASERNAVRSRLEGDLSVGRELAELGGASGLRDRAKELERLQSDAAQGERQARKRLDYVERDPRNIFTGAQEQVAAADVVGKEQEQADLLRERINLQRDIEREQIQALEKQQQLLRENASIKSFEKIPGIGGLAKRGSESAIAELEQDKQDVIDASREILRSLLNALKEQQHEVDQTRRNLHSLET